MNTSPVADRLRVTSSALRWRLVAMGVLPTARALALPEADLHKNGHDTVPPAPFSRSFADVMAQAIDNGRVSMRRLSALLGLTEVGMRRLFESHEIRCSAFEQEEET